MSDDLVKHCMCGCMYLEDECPNCNKVTDADRIEELEAKLAEVEAERDRQYEENVFRIVKEAEAYAKLDKAIWELERLGFDFESTIGYELMGVEDEDDEDD
jgi:hypothetical protein